MPDIRRISAQIGSEFENDSYPFPGDHRMGDTMETHNRRDVLKGIGAGIAASGTGVALGQEDEARLRVLHLSPDAPDVDVFIDDNDVLTGISFGDVSDYLHVAPGSYTVKITAAGDPGTVAFEGDVSVDGDTAYSVAAIGELSEETFEPLILQDDTRAPVSGISYVRVAHASPDAPAVDVTLFGGLLTLVKDLSFGDTSEYRALPTGSFTAEIRPAGGGDPVADVELELESETSYTAYANGYLSPDDEPDGEPFSVLAALDGEDQPDPTGRVRVAHASPDAPNVDLFLADERVLSDVPFRAVSDYLEVPAGTATAKLTAAGDEETVVFEGDLPIEAGTDYTVAAIGELSEESFRPALFEDDNSIDDSRARIRVIHASPDAPPVDVTADDGSMVFVDGLEFGDASGYLTVSPGEIPVEVRPDDQNDDNPFDAEFDLELEGGRVYTVFAEGYFTTFDEPANESFEPVITVDAAEH